MSPPAKVILLHGIGRTSHMMRRLATALMEKGYFVDNIDYPSTIHTVEELATFVFKKIHCYYDLEQPLHFVGHSLGGVVVRILLRDHRPSNLGRVVLIGPPNRGTIVVDFLSRFNFYKRWFGPAGQQIGTGDDSIPHQLPPADYECGIIAGNRSSDPWFSWFLFHTPNDGKVSVESTKLAGMSDHVVVPVSHAKLPKNAKVISSVIRFLETGHFHKDQ